jgi:hypothetical protein
MMLAGLTRHPFRAVFLMWLAGLLVAWPVGEFPVFDDWVYSRAAFRLAATGAMAIPESSSAVPPAQIVWGAAFAKVAGSSHLVLRISTIVAVAFGMLCWRRMLRLLDFDDVTSTWAVAIALLSPVMFLLTATFMTDAPFVAASQAALLAGVVWARRPQWSRMILAAALALVAAYVRQPGAAMLVGLAAAAIASARREQALAPLAAAGVLGFGQLWFARGLGARLPLVERAVDALAFMHVPLGFYVEGLVVAAAFVGLCAAPAALAAGSTNLRSVCAWLAVLVLAWIVWGAPVLRDGTMWGACELGGARSLLAGMPPSCAWSGAVRIGALLPSAIGLAAVAGVALAHVREAGRTLHASRRASRERLRTGGVDAALEVLDATDRTSIFLVVTFGTLAVGLAVLWLFSDRYWVLPAALAPALILGNGVRRPRLGMAWVAAYVLVAIVGTRGVFSFYGKVNAVVDALVAHGVAADEIDAGYCVNASRRYLLQPPAPTGEGRNANVPWVSTVAPSPWTLANRLEEGWTPARIRERAGSSNAELPITPRDGLVVERLHHRPSQRASSGFGTAGCFE